MAVDSSWTLNVEFTARNAVLIGTAVILVLYSAYKRFTSSKKPKIYPFKVIKPPTEIGGLESKRTVAVVGSTGMVGSHIVDKLIETGEYRVYMLGRRFNEGNINPRADAVFQVDMMDHDGLLKAFSGVDSVIHSAAAIPNVHMTDDEVWRINMAGSQNILSAAQKCGVKCLVFVSALKIAGEIRNKTMKIFMNAHSRVGQLYLDANGEHGMRTCSLGFGHIYGLSAFYEKVLSGQINRLPLGDHRIGFTPVSFAAEVSVKAEQKLAMNSEKVAGKYLPIEGYSASFKQFFTLPQWGLKIQNTSLTTLFVFAKINSTIALLTGLAPFGVDFCPAITSFFDMTEEKFDPSISQNALDLNPLPTLEDGIEEMQKEFNINKEKKKQK